MRLCATAGMGLALSLGCGVPSTVETSEHDAVPPAFVDVSEVDPWSGSLAEERALAAGDPRYAPRVDEHGAPSVASGAFRAAVDASGTSLWVADRSVSWRLAQVGRLGALVPYASEGAAEIEGPERR